MNRQHELLFEKYAALTFELEGHYDDSVANNLRLSAGSGFFIAPFQALTAKHVVNELHRTNPGWTDELRRQEMLRRPFESEYRWLPYYVEALQIADFREPNAAPARWGIRRVWPSEATDISMLELATEDPIARQLGDRMAPLFPTWSLLPPPVGTRVQMFGQPRDVAATGQMSTTCSYTMLEGTVVENLESGRDRGLYRFPCFSVNVEAAHGMSGGPVLYDGHLCGVISGASIEEANITYVAALWPLCLTAFRTPDLLSLDRVITFQQLFETGQLKASDWERVKGNISFRQDGEYLIPLLRPPL